MKKYVWSETRVEGGKPFTGTLPHPPIEHGCLPESADRRLGAMLAFSFKAPEFYADSCSRSPFKCPGERRACLISCNPKITSSGGTIDPALLTDGDLVKTTELPMAPERREGVDPVRIREAADHSRVDHRVAGKRTHSMPFCLPVATAARRSRPVTMDRTFTSLLTLPKGGSTEHTISFRPGHGQVFPGDIQDACRPRRIRLATSISMQTHSASRRRNRSTIVIAELVLHPGARVNRFEEKAAFNPSAGSLPFATPDVGCRQDVIQKSDVVDLTSKMRPDGTLDWTPPAGHWVVLRFGYSLLGITNHPATKEATGLEVDKLNASYVKNYMNGYLDSYKDTVGADMMGKRGIRYVVTDSWEAGAQNWTDDMIARVHQAARLRSASRGCRCSPGASWRARRPATTFCGTCARPSPT